MNLLLAFWWVLIPIVLLIFYRFFFRIFGVVIVPEDRIGLVTKKFVLTGENRALPDGRIIAVNGEAGFQAQTLAPGLHLWKWIWQYEVKLQPLTVIPPGKIGLLIAKDGNELPTGAILARRVDCDSFQDAEKFIRNHGQKGRQTAYITAGSYRINAFLFEVELADITHINENKVGIVTTQDGMPLRDGQIAGSNVHGHNNFQDADAFLQNGGNRGLQPQVILAGSYNLNPWFVQIEETFMTEIPIGNVGVVISYYGEDGADLSGAEFKHGNIVGKGFKGVWAEPLGPGKYPINKYTMRVELVPTTNLVLNWASARSESHQLDKNLSTITVRSKDGFPFNLDVSQIIHIPTNEAPKVIARFGNMNNLVSQVLEPTIGNYFRNSAQDADVINFLTSRKERQDSAKQHIGKVLAEYNVFGVDTLIGDIVPPDSLMKTLTDRKLAEEQKMTFETQRLAQETRQKLEKETSIADMQREIVKADQGVLIAQRIADASVKKAEGEATSVKIQAGAEAERLKTIANADAQKTKVLAEAEAEKVKMLANAEAEKISVTGDAEAAKILAIGKSSAEAYKLAVEAMGGDNFTKLKVTEAIGRDRIKIIPDVLINGGAEGSGGGPISGLLGLQLLEQVQKQQNGNGSHHNGSQKPEDPTTQI
ncbi:SPFH domain-containing protein [Cytophagaceae bacterium DM2B3-1]|uniref:SPFH domain-containing protein n=1 Tax=Xanthocytophaga flava TaxID=3048013 RepID=A0AAE3UBG8_9BACT|nr:SPFH domain-containing protein [Xanthocytophaga flavus]MDJ1469375.1 SPFH domain-containing protein [Xanthocytophaga flavus]MDJ1483769.1 SPFH domain-containing protein [Xanthocytophaga flavus]MDJ1494113.1 SPFH domain-containing protein [Xanthocytophaga flavus]